MHEEEHSETDPPKNSCSVNTRKFPRIHQRWEFSFVLLAPIIWTFESFYNSSYSGHSSVTGSLKNEGGLEASISGGGGLILTLLGRTDWSFPNTQTMNFTFSTVQPISSKLKFNPTVFCLESILCKTAHNPLLISTKKLKNSTRYIRNVCRLSGGTNWKDLLPLFLFFYLIARFLVKLDKRASLHIKLGQESVKTK